MMVWHGASASAALAAVAFAGMGHRARHVAPYQPVLERVFISRPGGAGMLGQLRIGFVSDLHIGPSIKPGDVDRALSLLLASELDLLLLGGDYVSESPRFIAETAEVLGNVVSASRLGALAVLGNHDYSNDAHRLAALFERRGIHVLRNEAARVSTALGPLWIAGVDDAILGSPDLSQAFSNIPAGVRSLALWHEPDWAESVVPYGAFVQLSGHSHGGQVRLPLFGTAAAPPGGRRFVAGLNHVAGMPVYTSRGVGVFRPPVRVRCPPEVTLITLEYTDQK